MKKVKAQGCLDASTSAFAFRGSWQAARAFPCHHSQASDKSQPRPFSAVLKPFAGALIGQWLDDPLGSWGQYSCRRGSCTCRWSVLWLGRGCQYFGHMLRIWSSVSFCGTCRLVRFVRVVIFARFRVEQPNSIRTKIVLWEEDRSMNLRRLFLEVYRA